LFRVEIPKIHSLHQIKNLAGKVPARLFFVNNIMMFW